VRERAASFLGCEADDLTITRSTTEAMNTVAQGLLLERGDRVLTTDQGNMASGHRDRCRKLRSKSMRKASSTDSPPPSSRFCSIRRSGSRGTLWICAQEKAAPTST